MERPTSLDRRRPKTPSLENHEYIDKAKTVSCQAGSEISKSCGAQAGALCLCDEAVVRLKEPSTRALGAPLRSLSGGFWTTRRILPIMDTRPLAPSDIVAPFPCRTDLFARSSAPSVRFADRSPFARGKAANDPRIQHQLLSHDLAQSRRTTLPTNRHLKVSRIHLHLAWSIDTSNRCMATVTADLVEEK